MRIEKTPEGYYLAQGFGYTREIVAEGETFNKAWGAFCDTMREQYEQATGYPEEGTRR